MPKHAQHMTIEKWFFVLITAIVAYLFWQILQPFIFIIIAAGVVAIILSPMDKRLKKLLKRPRLSASILSIATFFLLFVPILILLFMMVTQASDLVRTATNDTSWLDELKNFAIPAIKALPSVVQNELVNVDFGGIGKSVATWAVGNIGNIFSSSTQLILNTFIFFLCLYYLLVNRNVLYKEALALSPLNDKTDAKLIKRIVDTVRSVIFGVLIVAVVQGVIAGIGMTIFGVPGSIIWGALTVVAALIPILGTSLVIIPAVLYLLFTGSLLSALGLFIWGMFFVATIDNFLSPYLIGERANLHSFLVLISVLGGLAAFGAIGVIAGPTILAAFMGLIELYKSGILTT